MEHTLFDNNDSLDNKDQSDNHSISIHEYKVQLNALSSENKALRNEVVALKKASHTLEDSQDQTDCLKPHKTFGLFVSGDVVLNKMEVEIVNTPDFQRLDYIHQLGSTYTVYRTAHHTRFEHSLGTLKLVDIMINKIRGNRHNTTLESAINSEEEQIIRLLALLHDIGHMPFGHTIEDEFRIFQGHDKHELRWEHYLGKESKIGRIITYHHNKEFHGRFFNLIKCEKDFRGRENDAFMYDLVSNTICADLLDYLRRDCTYTNLNHTYNPRFLDYLMIKSIPNSKTGIPERRIAIRLCKTDKKTIRNDIQSELVQLIRNRYFLGERVYFHHAKIKTGTLIAGAVMRAKKANKFREIDSRNESEYRDGDGPVYDIHKMRDIELLVFLRDLKTGAGSVENKKLIEGAKYLAESYLNRIIYRELFVLERSSLESKHIKEALKKDLSKERPETFEEKLIVEFQNAESRLKYEEKISDLIPGIKSGDFLIYMPSYKMAMKSALVLVEEKNERIRPLKDSIDNITENECEKIINKHEKLWKLRVFIHPRFFEDDREKSGRNAEIIKLLKLYCESIICKDDENKEEKAFDFYLNVVKFYINYELPANEKTSPIYNPTEGVTGKKDKEGCVRKLAGELQYHTMGKRGCQEIKDKIKDAFRANYIEN